MPKPAKPELNQRVKVRLTSVEPIDQTPSFKVLKDSLYLMVKGQQTNFSDLYYNLQDILIVAQNSQYDIVTQIKENDRSSPTGRTIVRNATHAKPLNKRISPNSSLFESYNILLRTLETTRAIDHTLIGNAFQQGARPRLKKLYQDLLGEIIQLQKQLQYIAEHKKKHKAYFEERIANKLKALEKEYNTDLAVLLKANGLANDLEKPKDFAELLVHYRYLSALKDKAPTVVTIVYDEKYDALLTDTSYPITIKTQAQKKSLETLAKVNTDSKQKKNYHTIEKEAFQKANSAFFSMLNDDSKRLPAQMRKKIPATIKNGYFVKSEINFLSDGKKYVEWCSRAASFVYMGKGETNKAIRRETEENIEQWKINLNHLQKFLRNTDLDNQAPHNKFMTADTIHATVLNTDSPRANEKLIVREMAKAIQNKQQKYSYAPTNWDGTHRFNEIDPSVKRESHLAKNKNTIHGEIIKKFGELSVLSTPSNKKARLAQVSLLGTLVGALKNTINLFMCASGQDRTGTAVEATTQTWSVGVYQHHFKNNSQNNQSEIKRDHIEKVRVLGSNAPFIASAAVPGSPGMKQESKPGKYFSTESNEHLYLKSASTNKRSPINKDRLKKELSQRLAFINEPHISRRGREILASFDRFINSQYGRNYHIFLKSGKEKKQLIEELRNKIKEKLSAMKDGYQPDILLKEIEDWEKNRVAVGKKNYIKHITVAEKIALHRNLFYEETRPDQARSRSEQTETQKFIRNLKSEIMEESTLGSHFIHPHVR